MVLKKMKCESCGAAMDVPPNVSRVTCACCGTAYRVQNGAGAARPGRQTVSGDAPVGVRLVPLPVREVSLGKIYAPKNLFLFSQDSVFTMYSDKVLNALNGLRFRRERIEYNDPAEAQTTMRQKMTFFLGLSYAMQDSPLLKAQFPLDVVPLYYECGKEDGREGSPLTEAEKAKLQGPKKVYWDDRRHADALPADRLKRMNAKGEVAVYDSDRDTAEDKLHRQTVERLLKPYGFSCSEEKRFTSKSREAYRKVHWLQSLAAENRPHYRMWVKRFSLLTAELQLDPRKAAELMGAEGMDTLRRMDKNPVVDELAQRVARMLRDGMALRLKERRSEDVCLMVEDGAIGLGTIRYSGDSEIPGPSYYASDSALRGSGSGWSFREFGMSELPGVEVRCVLAALVTARALSVCGEGEAQWNVTGFEPAVQGYGETFSAVRLSPAFRAEGVYNSWL